MSDQEQVAATAPPATAPPQEAPPAPAPPAEDSGWFDTVGAYASGAVDYVGGMFGSDDPETITVAEPALPGTGPGMVMDPGTLVDPAAFVGPLPPGGLMLPDDAVAAVTDSDYLEGLPDALPAIDPAELQANAEEIAKRVREGDDWTTMFGGDDTQDVLAEMAPEMRAAVLDHLATTEGEGALTGSELAELKATEGEVTELEQQVAEGEKRREEKVNTSVAQAEEAAASGDGKTMAKTLDKLTPGQREDALEKMSPEARAAAEEELAKRRHRLEKAAETLYAAGADKVGTNEVDIVKTMATLSPSEAEELEELYGEKFQEDGKARSLRADLKGELDKDSKEYALVVAALDGDEEAKDLGLDLTVQYIEDEANTWGNTNEADINELLRAHVDDPEATKRIAEAYKARTGKDLLADLDGVMNAEEIKEASAYARNDRRAANVAVLEQGDEDRAEVVLDEARHEKGGIETLAQDVQAHTGKKLNEVVADTVSEDTAAGVQAEVEAAEQKLTAERDARLDADLEQLKQDPAALAKANQKAEQVASKLAIELGRGHYVGNNFDVTNQLRGLSPAEVKLVMDHYKKQAESIGQPGDLEADLRGKLDGKDLKVANAVLSGDKVLSAVAFVEQAGDGAGTNLDSWKQAMDTLETKEDREKFQALMDQHVGGVGGSAYDNLVKAEASSFDRDELQAKAIADPDERAAALAQVAVSRNAYGGQYATLNEGLQDMIGDVRGETEEERRTRRQGIRDNDIFMNISNAGGSEDAMLDAMQTLENPRQVELFNERMKRENGETTTETLEGEMSEHHLAAGKKLAEGDYEGALAERMVAELDCYVNDREKEASLPFENVRLSPDKQKELAAIQDPAERAKAHAAAKEEARKSLLARADEAAQAAGHTDYMGMLEGELSPAELAAAKDRIKDGKVSDVNALFLAGDTTIGNLGKDGGKFYEVMQDKTPAEMAKFKADFEKAHGIPLEEWVVSKATSDGEKRDFKIMLEGNYARMSAEELEQKAKDDPQALIKRVKDLHEAARGGAEDRPYDPIGNLKRKAGNEVGNFLADNTGVAGERLDKRMAAIDTLEKKLEAGEALSDAENQQLIDHMRYMAGDQKGYTEAKTKAAETVAEAAGTVTNVAVVATTGSTTAGDFAQGMVEIEVISTLDPARTSTDKLVGKTIETVGNAAMSGIAGKATKVPVLESAIEGGGGGIVTALSDTRNWNDAGTLADASLRQGATGVANGIAGYGVETVAGEGLVGSILEATTETAISGDLSKSGGELFAETAKSAATTYAKNKASAHHKKNNPERSSASADASTTTDVATTEGPQARDIDDAIAGIYIVDGERIQDPNAWVHPDDLAARQAKAAATDAPATDAAATDAPATDIEIDIDVDLDTDAPTTDDPTADAATTDAPTTDTPAANAPTTDTPTTDAPSAFGEEQRVRSKRVLVVGDDQPGAGTVARVSGNKVMFKFEGDLSTSEKQALVHDALARLGLSANAAEIEARANAGEEVNVRQQLRVADEEVARTALDRLYMDPQSVEARKTHTNEDLTGKCEKESAAWQDRLAEEGLFVPIMHAQGKTAPGRVGHRFLVVGDTIIDPTVGQFVEGGGANEDGRREPFIGSYEQLVDRLQEDIDKGRIPGQTSAADLIAQHWGIHPGKDGRAFTFDKGVIPIGASKGIQPETVEETRRMMDEQRRVGLEPGEGLTPALVAKVKEEDARSQVPPADSDREPPTADEPRSERAAALRDDSVSTTTREDAATDPVKQVTNAVDKGIAEPLDHVFNEKMREGKVEAGLQQDVKDGADLYTAGKAALDVFVSGGDFDRVDAKSLGEGVILGASKAVELVATFIGGKELGELTGKGIDVAKTSLQASVPELAARVGQFFKHLAKAEDGEAKDVALGLVRGIFGLPATASPQQIDDRAHAVEDSATNLRADGMSEEEAMVEARKRAVGAPPLRPIEPPAPTTDVVEQRRRQRERDERERARLRAHREALDRLIQTETDPKVREGLERDRDAVDEQSVDHEAEIAARAHRQVIDRATHRIAQLDEALEATAKADGLPDADLAVERDREMQALEEAQAALEALEQGKRRR